MLHTISLTRIYMYWISIEWACLCSMSDGRLSGTGPLAGSRDHFPRSLSERSVMKLLFQLARECQCKQSANPGLKENRFEALDLTILRKDVSNVQLCLEHCPDMYRY